MKDQFDDEAEKMIKASLSDVWNDCDCAACQETNDRKVETFKQAIPLAELLRDKARLDAAERTPQLITNDTFKSGKTLRQQCDAAIKEEKE